MSDGEEFERSLRQRFKVAKAGLEEIARYAAEDRFPAVMTCLGIAQRTLTELALQDPENADLLPGLKKLAEALKVQCSTCGRVLADLPFPGGEGYCAFCDVFRPVDASRSAP